MGAINTSKQSDSYFVVKSVKMINVVAKGMKFDIRTGGKTNFHNLGWNRPKIAIFDQFLAIFIVYGNAIMFILTFMFD